MPAAGRELQLHRLHVTVFTFAYNRDLGPRVCGMLHALQIIRANT